MAELDLKIGPVEIDLIAGAVKRGMAESVTEWRKLGSSLDRRIDFNGTVTSAQGSLSPATAFFDFSPSRPFSGRFWSVRKVVIQASTSTAFASTALSNVVAAIFVTGQPGGVAALSNNPPFLDAEATALTIPTTQFFSAHQLWVRGTDSLVIGIQGTGVTAGLSIFGHARVVEIDDDPKFLLDL